LNKAIFDLEGKVTEQERVIQETREVEMVHLKSHITDLEIERDIAKGKEKEAFDIVDQKIDEVEKIEMQMADLEQIIRDRESEIEKLNLEILKYKDMIRDFQAKVENVEGNHHIREEELINIKDQL